MFRRLRAIFNRFPNVVIFPLLCLTPRIIIRMIVSSAHFPVLSCAVQTLRIPESFLFPSIRDLSHATHDNDKYSTFLLNLIIFQCKMVMIGNPYEWRSRYDVVSCSLVASDRRRPAAGGGHYLGNPHPAGRQNGGPERGAQFMNVRWHLPDPAVVETSVTDVEQLQFLLKLVKRVQIRQKSYRWDRSELVVEGDRLYLSVYVGEETD
jgi:hypothetical protein